MNIAVFLFSALACSVYLLCFTCFFQQWPRRSAGQPMENYGRCQTAAMTLASSACVSSGDSHCRSCHGGNFVDKRRARRYFILGIFLEILWKSIVLRFRENVGRQGTEVFLLFKCDFFHMGVTKYSLRGMDGTGCLNWAWRLNNTRRRIVHSRFMLRWIYHCTAAACLYSFCHLLIFTLSGLWHMGIAKREWVLTSMNSSVP